MSFFSALTEKTCNVDSIFYFLLVLFFSFRKIMDFQCSIVCRCKCWSVFDQLFRYFEWFSASWIIIASFFTGIFDGWVMLLVLEAVLMSPFIFSTYKWTIETWNMTEAIYICTFYHFRSSSLSSLKCDLNVNGKIGAQENGKCTTKRNNRGAKKSQRIQVTQSTIEKCFYKMLFNRK